VQQAANQCAIAIRQSRLTRTATAQVQELENSIDSKMTFEYRFPTNGSCQYEDGNSDAAIASLPKQQRYIKVLQAECDREVELINNLWIYNSLKLCLTLASLSYQP